MASQVKTSTQLQLVFNAGVDEEGKAIIRRSLTIKLIWIQLQISYLRLVRH
ncbi:DUF1659 domain-containing protein [Piscibacillus salipiscarius]|uniref:DUF1659 domain-containing protein n=1 Tax=Piscibacillus salipiscarius TaxID=299480 RepID=UPI0024369ADD|nr:DUF1659 domain-containing protein [Piscibacillus salipiscarius]